MVRYHIFRHSDFRPFPVRTLIKVYDFTDVEIDKEIPVAGVAADADKERS